MLIVSLSLRLGKSVSVLGTGSIEYIVVFIDFPQEC